MAPCRRDPCTATSSFEAKENGRDGPLTVILSINYYTELTRCAPNTSFTSVFSTASRVLGGELHMRAPKTIGSASSKAQWLQDPEIKQKHKLTQIACVHQRVISHTWPPPSRPDEYAFPAAVYFSIWECFKKLRQHVFDTAAQARGLLALAELRRRGFWEVKNVPQRLPTGGV